jgi:lipoprotein-anchoring transpeptidase ErfK/SrfK
VPASAATLLSAALAALAPAAASAAPARASSPAAPTRSSAWIARLVAPTPAWPKPRATGRSRTLSPLGRWTGGPIGLLVLEVRRDWLRVLLPNRPNGRSAWITADRVRLVRTRLRVEIDLSERRITILRSGRVARRIRAVVGAPGTPTPRGRFAIYERARQPDPGGFLGPYALHLTAHSDVLDDYGGGAGRVAIHGRGGSSLLDPLGSAASHGCIRIDNAAVRHLARVLVPGVPVVVAS